METPDHGGPEDLDEKPQALVPYSTGMLTAAQAAAVEQWKARLHQDKPLPGVRRKGPMLREFYNLDDRPPCSLSDVIAAAVTELLATKPPDPLEVARYAYRTVRAQRAIADQGVTADSPVHKKVSFYLVPKVAARWETLREAAFKRQHEELKELRERAEQKYPKGEEKRERAMWFFMELARLGLPDTPLKITGGVIGRMAIDHARMAIDHLSKRQGVDRVVGDAVRYAAEVHEQPHRARRDVHKRK